jgi:hypothetical protein
MAVILAMGIGMFAPPSGVGYYAACAISRNRPHRTTGTTSMGRRRRVAWCPAEGVFTQLIESIGALLDGEWTIIASIRTFDLKNGRRYRDAMPGSPPGPAFADAALSKVRHVQVPRLTDGDFATAGIKAPTLDALLTAAIALHFTGFRPARCIERRSMPTKR